MALNVRACSAAIAAVAVSACASAPVSPSSAGPGAFVIERDLAGSTVARGEFSAITGLRRTFTAYLDGSLEGETFTLRERFEYDDGEKDQKTWVLTRTGPGLYDGTREDVVGTARGWQDGNAFRLEYDVRLPNADGTPGLEVRFRDVMVKTADGLVINHANVGKWGFNIGRVELTIRPAGK
jgi:hypothetical protein